MIEEDFQVGDIVYHCFDGISILIKATTSRHWTTFSFSKNRMFYRNKSVTCMMKLDDWLENGWIKDE